MKTGTWSTLLLAVMLAACTNETGEWTGTYSYSLSGIAKIDNQSYKLADEVGAMQVITEKDEVVVTWRNIAGGAYYTNAQLNDSGLTLKPFTRAIRLSDVSTDTLDVADTLIYNTYTIQDYEVEVTGRARKAGQTLLFELHYDGNGMQDQKHLEADKVTMVAVHN